MPRSLRALFLALLPLTAALAADSHPEQRHDPQEHASLAAHEHGSAQLNLALDGRTLELEFASPAMNLLGFEHAPRDEADKALVVAARGGLSQPLVLFGVPTAAACQVVRQELEGELLEEEQTEALEHSEIRATYRLDCAKPGALAGLDLSALFEAFPATQRIQVQLIGPHGQRGEELDSQHPRLNF